MLITVDHPDAARAVIKLDGRPIECVAADDEEGWVEVVDLIAMVNMDLDNETKLDITDIDDTQAYDGEGRPKFSQKEGMEVKTKKRYGKVEITIQ